MTRNPWRLAPPAFVFFLAFQVAAGATAEPDRYTAMARAFLTELIEINTGPSGDPGSTRLAASRLAGHLRRAGFPEEDLHVIGTDESLGNLVARYRSPDPKRRPIMMMAHLDVVEALRSDWSVEPFEFLEHDGYIYGRGSLDNKAGCAILVANFIRLREEGFEPDRDLIIVLTADEETTGDNIKWLLAEQRPLIDAAFALNTDGGSILLEKGAARAFLMQTSEKVYATYRLQATNPGGHSSQPRPDNAIYTLAAALMRIADYRFPIDLNDTTRAFFARWAELADEASRPMLRALANGKVRRSMEQQLAESGYYNALSRTTCVATELAGGHAENALPQTATATINCRILPHHSPEDVEAKLKELASTGITMTTIYEPTPSPPSPLTPEPVDAIEAVAKEMWPGIVLIPEMSTGATDGLFVRNAGIPVYAVSAIAEHANEERAHGRDERIHVKSFYEATEYWYRLAKRLARNPP